jgi:hypothetical protein
MQGLGELAPVVEPCAEDLLRTEFLHASTLARGTDTSAMASGLTYW